MTSIIINEVNKNEFRRKLGLTEYRIMAPAEYSIKSKIRKIFVKGKLFEEHCVKIYEIEAYFYKHYPEKIKVYKNRHEYLKFRIGVYCSKYDLAVEVDEKGHADSDLIFEKKRQEALQKKKLIVNLLELILIKKIMMYFMKLVEYKHLLVSLKIKNKRIKRNNKTLKRKILKNKIIKDGAKKRKIISAQNTWLFV